MKEIDMSQCELVSGGEFYYGLSVDNASNSENPYYGFTVPFGRGFCFQTPYGSHFFVCTA
ncbi:hypothetical protein [Dyella sp. EPa41]|uniref:hypothetical protein n=1 Tax=Dyella sp. EPa41 TaxID=1561194 RepID=UPI0019169B2A|nr:hypothetical protein [Dyella sp. EPa41]